MNGLENWKDIRGYEGLYQVSDQGNVRSLTRTVQQICGLNGKEVTRKYLGKVLKFNSDRKGYLYLSLSTEGKQKTFKVHRLVAEHFIPNPQNLPEVNHLYGKKEDNRVSSLEWSTSSGNKKHAINMGLKENPFGDKAHNYRGDVEVYNKEEKLIDILKGHKDIISKGYSSSGVSACLTGRQKTHRGCTFKLIHKDRHNG